MSYATSRISPHKWVWNVELGILIEILSSIYISADFFVDVTKLMLNRLRKFVRDNLIIVRLNLDLLLVVDIPYFFHTLVVPTHALVKPKLLLGQP